MFKSKINQIALTICLSVGLSSAALAQELSSGGVTVYKNSKSVFTNNEAQFSQSGLSSEMPEIIKGYGKNIPFSITLDIVVPKHWDISFNEGAERLLVNWDSGNDGLAWPYVLEDLSKKNNVSVAIDWERKSVNLFAHGVADVNFAEMESRDESYVVDSEGERIDIEQILSEKENYVRVAQILEAESAAKEAALKENEKLIAELQAQMEAIQREEDLIANYGSGMTATADGNVAYIDSDEVPMPRSGVTDAELRREYDSRFVLPINPSFDFYRAGGWQQEVDFLTPATFLAKRGMTIKEIMENWAKEIGWELTYNSTVHYFIDFDMEFQGLPREAFVELLSLYESSQRPLDVNFYVRQNLIVIDDLQFRRRNF